MDKTYNPKKVESKWYTFWTEKRIYNKKTISNNSTFSIVIPPPNVTGSLHIGHALNNTLQDILVRYKRMKGFDVIWIPGTDHAGIATQMVVEKEIAKEGIDKNDIGREVFIEKIWEWKNASGDKITTQLRRLGALPNWDRERFTMDHGLSNAVRKVFVELYRKGLIYQDKRLVNWDPKLNTAISDLEVEQREVSGQLWYLKYPIKGYEGQYITVATTRPETMLGDTAVAVHPDDQRYKNLIGEYVTLPLVGREIPIIADEYSDPEKGSGAVKITPAHDFNDFEVGKRHGLPAINIFDENAHLNENAPKKYRGLDRFDARVTIVNDLDKLGLLDRIENNKHTVPYGDRSGVVVEPYLTDQWYMNVNDLAQKAIKSVESGDIMFHPRFWGNTFFEWMRNIQPWCISRQIWWGHQIPAWCGPDGEVFVEYTEEDALQSARNHYGKTVVLTRETDVLDTWFSSALWPFTTMGWPEKSDVLRKYYPTSVMVTGFDIIFFWVARMIMMGLNFMNDVPFKDVYIHGLIRDEKGQKMSKTRGNVIDPLEIIEEHGADSLRFTLAALATQGRDIKLSPTVIQGYRNFINKIWNASRFIIMNLEGFEDDWSNNISKIELEDTEKWIITKLNYTIEETNDALESYEFDKAANSIYQFIWGDFCDWYIEISKPIIYGDDINKRDNTRKILVYVLLNSLRLLHPIAPFITEELFHLLKDYGIKLEDVDANDTDSIALASFPEYNKHHIFEESFGYIEFLKNIVVGIRNLRALIGIHPSQRVEIVIYCEDSDLTDRIKTSKVFIQNLASVSNLVFKSDIKPKNCIAHVLPEVEIFLPVEGLIDIRKEIKRLSKEFSKVSKDLEKTERKLSSSSFLEKAPDDVIEKEKFKLSEFLSQRDKIQDVLKKLTVIGS